MRGLVYHTEMQTKPCDTDVFYLHKNDFFKIKRTKSQIFFVCSFCRVTAHTGLDLLQTTSIKKKKKKVRIDTSDRKPSYKPKLKHSLSVRSGPTSVNHRQVLVYLSVNCLLMHTLWACLPPPHFCLLPVFCLSRPAFIQILLISATSYQLQRQPSFRDERLVSQGLAAHGAAPV